MSYLTEDELRKCGFNRMGVNVRISRFARLYNCRKISLGNNVRIDDFCVLSAGEEGIEIGDYVHIAVFCSLMGKSRIILKDFSGLSSRVSVYSSSDDYSGQFMTNPTVPTKFTGSTSSEVSLGRHVIVGAGSIILPGVKIEDGTAVGALSLVSKPCDGFWIYAGNPAKKIKPRKRFLLDMETQLLSEQHGDA